MDSLEEKSEKELLIKIAKSTRWRNVVARAIVNGVFTAIGATFGFALLVLFLARFYASVGEIPLVEEFMKSTQLDKVVEYVIQESNQDVSVEDKVED